MSNREYKILRLNFGEYYDLKITDSSKNVINQVEVTPVKITTECVQRYEGFAYKLRNE